MLTSAIIYPMGAGGNFLNRLLTLSEKTIPLIKHESVDIDQVELEMSAQDRFDLYNHFDVTDWRSSEYAIIMQFHWGFNDFYKYEISQRYLICSWHPHVFLNEDSKGMLWGDNAWKNIIFIECDDDDKKFINSVGIKKDYPPNTPDMYYAQEILISKYTDRSIRLPFKTLLDQKEFVEWLNIINQTLSLNLDLDLAVNLWQSWFNNSQQCWYNTTNFNKKNTYGQVWDKKIIKAKE